MPTETNRSADTPARRLLGQRLSDKWTVIESIQRLPGDTGGSFSASYVVRSDNGDHAFLKAMDYTEALRSKDPARALQKLTEVYNFERDILEKCRSSRLSRVVHIVDAGTIPPTPEDSSSVVQYIIFELAKGDIRSSIRGNKKVKMAWALRRLHQVAAALRQLHYHGIAHQDVKPSNILVFERGHSKLGDLGRASDRGRLCPFDTLEIAGDRTYAPPELLYGEIPQDWATRRLACDMYLLGSIAVYFCSGVSMTHLLLSRLDERFLPTHWGSSYRDVLPYIAHAFIHIIRDIKEILSDPYSEDIAATIRQLCNPDPEFRGHPKNMIHKDFSRYSIERYVSIFDRLATRAEYSAKRIDMRK